MRKECEKLDFKMQKDKRNRIQHPRSSFKQIGQNVIVPKEATSPKTQVINRYNSVRCGFRNLQKQESGTASIPQAKIQPAFRKKPEPDTSHDEELARKLFEEENKPPSSSQGLPGLIPAVNDFLGLSICKGCNQPLSYGQFYQTGTGKYHTSCFICQACGQIISSPTFRIQNDLLYHPQCAMELFSPRCVVCELPIAANSQGQITFIKHPFFDEKSCAHHKSSCARCCACMRFEPQAPSKAFSQLADGRKLCMACCRTVVLDSDEAQPIFHRILAWFEAELGLRIPEEMRQVPVLLVDELTLNEKSSRCGHESVAGVPTTRGLTLSEEGTIQHMGPGVLIFDPYTGQIRQGPMQVYKMGRVKSVTAILVLGGLPYDLCSSVLAHECFHAWLRTQIDFPNLPSQVEEGMCQLIAHLWLTHNKQNLMQRKSSYGKLLDGPTDEALRNLFLYQIETNDSEVYGDGFRFAAQAYASLGLEILIAHLKTHQAFPVT